MEKSGLRNGSIRKSPYGRRPHGALLAARSRLPGENEMRWYRMPVEDIPADDYRQRAERFHRMAAHLSDRESAARFEAMAVDAEAIADRKSRESVD